MVEDGPYTKDFHRDVSKEDDLTIYKLHVIKDGEAERKKFKDSANNFVQELVDRLESTFPDGDLLSAFNILDPQNLPTEPDRSSYGEKELTKILHHFEAHENMFDQALFIYRVIYGLTDLFVHQRTGLLRIKEVKTDKDHPSAGS